MWALEDMTVIRPNSKEFGIMVSNFIDQHSGYLRLTDDHELATSADPTFPKEAHALLEYGAEHEGYWTNEKFMNTVADIAQIAD